MRKLLLALSILLLISTVSCNSSLEGPTDLSQSFIRESSENLPNTTNYSYEVAKTMASSALTDEMIKEVHNAVTKSMEYGLDESIYFAELFSPGKIIPNKASTVIGNSIKSRLISDSSSRLSEKNMDEKGLQIYWPYSANWDGATRPYIYKAIPILLKQHRMAFHRLSRSSLDSSIQERIRD